MLPGIRQRLTIALALTLGVGLWLVAMPGLMPFSGEPGLVALRASAGPLRVAGWLALTALLGGLIWAGVRAWTGPAAAWFVITTALTVPAAAGGSLIGFVRETRLRIDLEQPDPLSPPLLLVAEAGLWLLWIVVLALVANAALARIEPAPGLAGQPASIAVSRRALARPGPAGLVGLLITATLAAVVESMLLQSWLTGQSVCSAAIGGFLGGAAVGTALQRPLSPGDRLLTMLGPLLVVAATFGWIHALAPEPWAFVTAYFDLAVPRTAMITPLQALAAGGVGITLGLGLTEPR